MDCESQYGAGRAAQGLTLGQAAFPPALRYALARVGVYTIEMAGLSELEGAVRKVRPDFVIFAAADLGPDPEHAIRSILDYREAATLPVFLIRAERGVIDEVTAATPFSDVLGSGEDALDYFILIRASLRRKRPHVLTEVLQFGALSLDQERFLVRLNGTEALVKKLEFCMLGAMLDAPRMVWNRHFLNRVVFGPVDRKPGRQFDTWMSLVRRSIRAKTGVDPIVTKRGRGYALSTVHRTVPSTEHPR